eukprot:4404042-Pleurochrysis_carterae.AAC.2
MLLGRVRRRWPPLAKSVVPDACKSGSPGATTRRRDWVRSASLFQLDPARSGTYSTCSISPINGESSRGFPGSR